MTFAERVKLAIDNDWTLIKRLSERFHVAESTVVRWASGTATPHPYLQETILSWLI